MHANYNFKFVFLLIVCQYPDEVIQHCVNNLINESIEERKCAVKTMRYIFKVKTI